jgi:UDP-glucose 4-epimerase
VADGSSGSGSGATVLVTGGAGYIGSHACRRLAEIGHAPVCLDNFQTGWREAARFCPVIECDLLDAQAVSQALAELRPDAVMHFAARSLVGESMEKPSLYWRNNVVGTLNLLDAMQRAGTRRLVFSSTAATYGAPEADLISEDTALRPTNPYGTTKSTVERLIADHADAYGLQAVVFRYFNVAGAARDAAIGEQHHPETHLIPLMLEVALGQRQMVTIFGDDYSTPDGTCIRDYLHVEDLVDAHLLGLDRLLADKGALIANLGTGRGYSVTEVLSAARQITGHPIDAQIGARRAGDPPRLVCDPARARRELGWSPERSDLHQMIADAWRWARRGRYRI